MKIESEKTETFTILQASWLLGVHPDTIRRAAKQGGLKFTRNRAGHYRFTRAALEEFWGEEP